MSLSSFRAATALPCTVAGLLLLTPCLAHAEPKLSPPELVERVTPEYPESKKTTHESAQVELTLTVDETGAVTDVQVKRSAGTEFDTAATDAAKKLRFSPATRDGQPISARIPFLFDFEYQEPKPAAAPAATPAPTPAPRLSPKVAPTPAAEVTDVEIVGERAPREVTRRAVNQEEVRKMPGTNGDALRSLESMPGVARPPAGEGMLLVRGSGPEDTAIFADGTSIPIAYHFGDFNSVLPSELLERIDFYPGNFGPEYGRAIGGIVDIGIRSPRRDGFHGLAQVDLIDARLMAEAPLGDHTRVLVAGRRSWLDAWIGGVLEQGGAVGVTTAPVYYDYQAVLEHDISRNTTARLLLFGSDDRMRIVVNAPDASDPSFSGDFGGHIGFQRLQLRTDTRFDHDTRWINTVSVGRDRQQFDSTGFNLDLTYEPVQVRSDFRSRVVDGVSLVAGLDATWTAVNASYQGPPIVDGGTSPGPLFARPANDLTVKGSLFAPAAYAMLELSPSAALRVMPGVRVDHSSDIEETRVSPRIAARWDVASGFPRTTIKGGVGLYYQAPQPHQTLAPFGTPTLSHERALHYGLGFEQELTRDVELSVDGFYKDLGDLVVQHADARAPSGVGYDNSGSGRAYGAEVLLRYKPSKRFFGWVAYTLSRSERRDGNEKYHLFDWDQTHILSAVASYKLGRGWELGARFRYVTGKPYTPATAAVFDSDAGAYQPIDGLANSARDPAFHRLDVRLEKTWSFEAWKLSAYVDVQNAYNRKNVEGRSYNYNYSKSGNATGLPILPIVGLRGEL